MEEECIICLETIDRTTNNFRTDICENCNYIVHLDCYEKYIVHNNKEICVVCNKEIPRVANQIIPYTIVRQSQPSIRNDIQQTTPDIHRMRQQSIIILLFLLGSCIIIALLLGIFFKRS